MANVDSETVLQTFCRQMDWKLLSLPQQGMFVAEVREGMFIWLKPAPVINGKDDHSQLTLSIQAKSVNLSALRQLVTGWRTTLEKLVAESPDYRWVPAGFDGNLLRLTTMVHMEDKAEVARRLTVMFAAIARLEAAFTAAKEVFTNVLSECN